MTIDKKLIKNIIRYDKKVNEYLSLDDKIVKREEVKILEKKLDYCLNEVKIYRLKIQNRKLIRRIKENENKRNKRNNVKSKRGGER